MSTPSRSNPAQTLGSTTPKLGRGIEQPDISFETRSVHQSGSKVVETRMLGLNEQIIKRKTELAELLRSTGKKRAKKNEPGEDIRFISAEFPDISGANERDDDDFFAKFGAVGGGSLLSDSFMASPSGNDEFSEATSYFTENNAEVFNTSFTATTTTNTTARRRRKSRTCNNRRLNSAQHSVRPEEEEVEVEVVQGESARAGFEESEFEYDDDNAAAAAAVDALQIDGKELWEDEEEEEEEEEEAVQHQEEELGDRPPSGGDEAEVPHMEGENREDAFGAVHEREQMSVEAENDAVAPSIDTGSGTAITGAGTEGGVSTAHLLGSSPPPQQRTSSSAAAQEDNGQNGHNGHSGHKQHFLQKQPDIVFGEAPVSVQVEHLDHRQLQRHNQHGPPSSLSASSSLHNVSVSAYFDQSPLSPSTAMSPAKAPLSARTNDGTIGGADNIHPTGTISPPRGVGSGRSGDANTFSAEHKTSQQSSSSSAAASGSDPFYSDIYSPSPTQSANHSPNPNHMHSPNHSSPEHSPNHSHNSSMVSMVSVTPHGQYLNQSNNQSFSSTALQSSTGKGTGGTSRGLAGTEYGSMSYTESLVHQLKVARSKNEMLQGKLRDIEELVDRNYGSISERSKLLTTERNKLERQRAQLDDELVATKEELLFIRAQLQNKSARISELETELLEAQRMIVVPSSAGESDNESLPSEEEGGQLEYLEGGQHVQQMQQLTAAGYSPQTPFAHAQAQPLLSTGGVKTPASATAPGSSRLQAGSVPSAELFASGNKGLEGRARLEEVEEEVRRLRQKESEKEREVEILKSLLVDQEQQLTEAAADKEALQQLTAQYQEAIGENFQLAGYLEAAEKSREELSATVEELERRLKETDDLAFEQEARVAQLEEELFEHIDAEHERVQQLVAEEMSRMKVRSPAPSPKHQQLEQLQIEATSSSSSSSVVIPQVVYATDNSVSPRLSLLRRPYSTPRVPRDGYAFLLILVAMLQIAVWALLLLVGLLYLGVLEGRFGVDILRDGGVYEQLFMLRGVTQLGAAASAAARDSAYLTTSVQYCTAAGQGVYSSVVETVTQVVAVGRGYLNTIK